MHERSWSTPLHALAIVTALAGCPKDKPKEGPAPPPSDTASRPAACAGGGGTVDDPHSAPFFPRTTAGYCIDPAVPTRAFGENAKLPREEVCTSLFDGECEIYFRHKLSRVVAVRYVDGGGRGSTVDVYLSTFADPSWSYAMYTKRVIADADPADESAPKSFAAGGAAVLGTGRAYVWKGSYIAELQYNNEQEVQAEIAKNASPPLTTLAKEIADRLPGSGEKPPPTGALPVANLVTPSAIQFFAKDTLGLDGLGAGALGYYREGGKRHRVVAFASAGVDNAKTVLKTLGGRPGALPVADVGDEGILVVLGSGAGRTEWVFARKGATVMGVGDEEFAVQPKDPPDKIAAAHLTKDEKVTRLRQVLSGGPASPGVGVTPNKK